MKLKAKHSGKFLSVKNSRVCQANAYEWEIEYCENNNAYFYIVSSSAPNKCLQPCGGILKDKVTIELNEKSENLNYQLWKFEESANSNSLFYITNRAERREGHKNFRRMCIDVRDEKKEEGADIIIFHIKSPNVNEPGNQMWEKVL